MAWVCVNERGMESIYEFKPRRITGKGYFGDWGTKYDVIGLPKGSIKRLIGKDLSWSDEPVELKEE